jgi:hypothetical protein
MQQRTGTASLDPVPGWERPTLAVLSNLLVPLALWIVALSNDDLLHAALLFAFLLSLVWPGNRVVLASTVGGCTR